MSQNSPFRFPFIRPVMPAVEKWSHYLHPAYEARWFSNFGPVALRFEAELCARLCHRSEIITTTNNCTSGIAAALIASGVSGSVAIPAFTFPATASAVIMAGAKPCVLDVDLETWSLSATLLEKFLRSEKFEAVVLVAPFGLRQDFSAHIEACRACNVPVLIDNAAGLSTKGSPLPDSSCYEIYSLHATKPFAIGEGGAIRSRDDQREGLRHALNFGLEHGIPVLGRWGINGKLSEVSAAIGLAVLKDFDQMLANRCRFAQSYIDLFNEHKELIFPSDATRGPWQTFPVLFPSASTAHQFVQNVAARGVQTRIGYSPSLEGWPRTRAVTPCPHARSLAQRMVLLPVYSDATDNEIVEILKIVRESLSVLHRA